MPSPTAVCLATVASVGLLLQRQVRLLLSGHTYLDALPYQRLLRQAEQAAPVATGTSLGYGMGAGGGTVGSAGAAEDGPSAGSAAGAAGAAGRGRAMDRLRRIFGSGHPVTWLLPAWDAAQAGTAGSKKLS